MPSSESDLREPQVQAMCEKYQYEAQHCHRVADLAQRLFDLLEPLHKLGAEEAALLRHGALLHDLGHFIGYPRHHKHSAYLIRHEPILSAYAEPERELLALMARNHRKRPVAAPHSFSKARAQLAMQLSAILRLADGMDHDRAGTAAIADIEITKEQIRLRAMALDLEGLAEVLREKAVLIKRVFGRKVVWETV